MKKLFLLMAIVLVTTGVALAQIPYTANQTTDVLGAHMAYGRGCVACHAPHSGSLGNGVTTTKDPNNGMVALWGEDVYPLYGQVFNFGGGNNPVSLPASGTLTSAGANPGDITILFCLSCHDGNLAKGAMMTGHTVETLPVVGNTAPTFLGAGNAVPTGGAAYNNDHPVGITATVGCGSASHGWDCSGGVGTTRITMNGANSSAFLANNLSSFWNKSSNPLTTYSGVTANAVICTTCHNQHSMTAWTTGVGTSPIYFTTMFFIKGYYNPVAGSNSVAQFCRNCHGGESNEMQGVLKVPTT